MNTAEIKEPRVCLLSEFLRLGGSTTFLCLLGGEFLRRGVPIQVVGLSPEHPLASDFERLRIPVSLCDDGSLIFEDRLLRALQEIRRFGPTSVVASIGGTAYEALRYLPSGILRIGIVHSDDPVVYGIVRRYAAFVDAMVGVSPKIVRELQRIPEFGTVPLSCIPYGLSLPEAGPRRAPHASEALRILYVGRLDREQKRVHLFPNILRRLVSFGFPFLWTIAGEGAEREALQASMATARPSQQVVFTGPIPHAAVPGLMRDHDVFLLASDYEGLPIALLEAMASGLVPVVSDLPSGIPEAVDDAVGIRVPPDQPDAYADAIRWLHEHRDALAGMSRAAQERVRSRFSGSGMADQWMQLLCSRPPVPVLWPPLPGVRPILGTAFPLRYSPPFRPPRRLLKRMRAGWLARRRSSPA